MVSQVKMMIKKVLCQECIKFASLYVCLFFKNAENRVREWPCILSRQDFFSIIQYLSTKHLRILTLITTATLSQLAKAWSSSAVIHVMGELRPYSEVVCIPLYSYGRFIPNYCMCNLFCPEVGFWVNTRCLIVTRVYIVNSAQ